MSSMHHLLRRGAQAFVATTAACLLTATLAPIAQASDSDTRAEADRLMNLSYRDFIQAKDQRPDESPFDWDDDGCSGPGEVQWIYRDLFDGPCQQHDFGYRNYGPKDDGPQLQPDEDGRAFIDDRFGQEMQRLCNNNFDRWYQRANRAACLNQAIGVWTAVRHRGREAFYATD